MTTVERVQTGVRMERSLLKVLKGLAEYLDLSLGDLLEGIVLHAFEGEQAFGAPTLEVIARPTLEPLPNTRGADSGIAASILTTNGKVS